MIEQPAGAAKQGGQEEDQRGRDLPQRSGGGKACGLGLERAARRVAGLQTLLQRRISGEAGAKGGGDRAAAVDGGLGTMEPCRGDLHT
jgi:hypothetical protein